MGLSASPRSKVLQLLDGISGAPEVIGDLGLEKSRSALQALSIMLAGKDEAVPQEMLPEVAACLLGCLADRCSSKSALPLDRPSSRYFYTLLRTLQAAVSQMENLQGLSLTTLVDCLRRFWVYGLTAPRATAPEPFAAHEKSSADDTPPASPRITSYRPPHLRSRQRTSCSSSHGQWRCGCDDSASECSDTESVTASVDPPHRASHVRIASLICLQTMAKADGKSLHPTWSAIFPVHTPLTGRPSMTTLMDVIASDPQPKVRAAAAAAAAALMEGPRQQAYLAMAEHRKDQTLRGFTTLSAVLGKLAMCTHEALLQALSSEANPAALTALLRFAAVLFGVTPYQRLPPTLLPGVLQDMRRVIAERLPVVATCAEELAAMQCAALSCLGAPLTAYACVQLPAAGLSIEGIQGSKDAAIAGLPGLLAGLASTPAAAVSAEALAALQPIASAQPAALRGCWHRLREIVVVHVEAKPLAGEAQLAAGAERAAVQGLRLLGCYLKACAERAAPALTCSLLQSPALAQTVSGMRQALGDPAAADALQEWRLTCCKVLPQAAAHERAAVRCAAMALFRSLSEPVYGCLSLTQQRQIWQCIQLCNADSASAVHAASLKALGTLAMCPSFQTYPGLLPVVQVLQEGLTCPVASVQLAAAWALANTAGTVASSAHCPGNLVASIAEAALAAAGANEKAQANAIRALGHLLASSHSDGQSITEHSQSSLGTSGPSSPSSTKREGAQGSAQQDTCGSDLLEGSGSPDLSRGSGPTSLLQQRLSPVGASGALALGEGGSAGEQAPAWVEPGLSCLIRALQSGSVKVQWNACYAVGAVLRCRRAAAAAWQAGLLGQLLLQLLQTLKHSSNFKTRTHAAAALANIPDIALLESVGCDNLVQSLQEASDVLQDDISKPCNDHEQSLKVDVTNIQSYQALKQQLRRSLCHIQALRSFENTIP